MAATDQKVIATAALVSVGVGTANSIMKEHRTPSARFLIGSGLAFLALSVLSEWNAELAKSLAIAVTVTVVLGEGDGLFSYVNAYGEADTQRPKRAPTPRAKAPAPQTRIVHRTNQRGQFQADTLAKFPGLTSTPPVLPNH